MIINFIVVTTSGPIFLNFVTSKDHTKNKYYIAKKLMDCIKEVGHQNVVQIITDNAHACRLTGAIMEANHPHILDSV